MTTGKLYLVSAGPGDPALMAPRAKQAIDACSDIVAYGLYLDLLEIESGEKTLHDLPLGDEVPRARLALDLAAGGRTTALVSSGDVGIYAMATLVFELLHNELESNGEGNGWTDVTIDVIPGVSAMQANASTSGAILGHDFCTISLSDLLTPWETIEQRIHAAGKGDFVVSFYNPVSKKRNWQLDAARDILLDYRPGSTPVVLGRNLTRPGQWVKIIGLAELQSEDVDMFTCVTVGNRETRRLSFGTNEWVYTPRGYAQKL